jgi:hypothetical protein
VLATQVEVLSFQSVEIRHLKHGVGATDVSRGFKVNVGTELARYRARYLGDAKEYVRILARKDDVFDVEVTTQEEGLYGLRLHVVGVVAGRDFDIVVEPAHLPIVFFDKAKNYKVDRSPGYTPDYSEYMKELCSYDQTRALESYL